MRNQALPNETLVSATTEEATENEISEEGCSEILADHLSFIDWYLNYIGTELGATKSYQQHITALKVLQQVKQFGLDHYINVSHSIFDDFLSLLTCLGKINCSYDSTTPA